MISDAKTRTRFQLWRHDVGRRLSRWEDRWVRGESVADSNVRQARQRLPETVGVNLTDDDGPAWAIAIARSTRWPHWKTPSAAAMDRFCENGDWAEGMMLAETATRFVRRCDDLAAQIVCGIPGPDVFRPFDPLSWLVARIDFGAELVCISANEGPVIPSGRHELGAIVPRQLVQRSRPLPDVADYALLPKDENLDSLWTIDDESKALVAGKRVLVVDLHWQRGLSMRAVARRLTAAGARSVARMVWICDARSSV